MITVFTPTYNRAYTLQKLYESLCNQICKDFEWLVVDDGSTDETSTLFEKWKTENKIRINVLYRTNGGKSTAINLGVQNAKGNLFFIVDSDDFLTVDAVEKLVSAERKKKIQNYSFPVAGFCYRRKNYRTGELIGFSRKTLPTTASSLELSFKYGFVGDKAEVFYTDILRQFPFPDIPNNKFVPEALVWYHIAANGYKLIIIDEAIYQCDYIADGYTKNFKSNLKKNCRGFALFYKECLKYQEIPLFIKVKYLVRFLQCKLYEMKI
ncbi:glycosyltransferase family A protein [Treponema bryantii]|uniref:glycosyltransferase family A protein n=1 Tax=Treponema bryantii TaxID=163 RepID=UPI0003B51058|nr:glycosyltransferase family 2 protein [Treponema bryantii]